MLKIIYIDTAAKQIYDDAATGQKNLVAETIKLVVRPDVSFDVVHVNAPSFVKHVRYHYYTELIKAPLLEQIIAAEKNGYHAVIIGCFADPGIKAAREVVRIPVIGPGYASIYIASLVSTRFSIITSGGKANPRMQDLVRQYGLEHMLVSVRDLGLTAQEIVCNPEAANQKTLELAKKSIAEDKAEAIVLGCCAEANIAQSIQDELGVPVIDPVIAAVKVAEMMADLHQKVRLSNSTIGTYEPPPEFK